MSKKILVYGFYKEPGNFGDRCFKEAFRNLFPQYEFYFTDHITLVHLDNIDNIIFGGGSFLDQAPAITEQALNIIKTKQIFYLGIGTEGNIHTIHQELLKLAKVIFTRSRTYNHIKAINAETYYAPDLVFALQNEIVKSNPTEKKILILPNVHILPCYSDPYWMHVAWEKFKVEFGQFLDVLVEKKFNVGFYAMSQDTKLHDRWAATEIIGKMQNRDDQLFIQAHYPNFEQFSKFLSSYQFIITQRYHGAILAEMTDTPYLNVAVSDKMKGITSHRCPHLDYYGATKNRLLELFYDTIDLKFVMQPIKKNSFEELVKKVISYVGV